MTVYFYVYHEGDSWGIYFTETQPQDVKMKVKARADQIFYIKSAGNEATVFFIKDRYGKHTATISLGDLCALKLKALPLNLLTL